MTKTIASIAIIVLSLFSCTSQKVSNEIKGVWVVEVFEINGEDRLWEELSVNMAEISENGVYKTPLRNPKIDDKAKWDIIKKNDKYYLKVTGAKDSIFNGKFHIKLSTRKQGSAILKELELSSNHLYMKWSQ